MISAGKNRAGERDGPGGLEPASSDGLNGDRDLRPRIVIVGVCGSGKSLLADRLNHAGFDAHPVAQEHSLVPFLFRNSGPDFVIYLEASDATVSKRKRSGWEPAQLEAQRRRLRKARAAADLVLETDDASPEELLASVRVELARRF